MADHSGSASDITFRHGSGSGAIEGFENVLSLNVMSMDVIEAPIPSFSDDRQGSPPRLVVRSVETLFTPPMYGSFVYSADTVGIGKENRLFQKT